MLYLQCYGCVIVNQCSNVHDLAPRMQVGMLSLLLPTIFSPCSTQIIPAAQGRVQHFGFRKDSFFTLTVRADFFIR